MLSHGLPIRLARALAILGLASCGADKPPPRSAVEAAKPSAARASTGSSSASLGDSALEPAAIAASKEEDWPRAESLYRELARRQPRNSNAKRALGIALLRQHQIEPAIAAFEDSLRLADDAQTRVDLAAAFAASGRYASGLPHLRKAVQTAPDNPSAWAALAQTLIQVEKPDGAAEALGESRRVCRACPDDEGWNRIADEVARACVAEVNKRIAAGDTTGAKKTGEAARMVRPELPETQLALGKIARAEGNRQAAAAAYRKAVDGLPDAKVQAGAAARLELATLLLSDGGGAESVKLVEQVIAARGDDVPTLDTLGRACDATRDTNCARKAYAKLVKLPAARASSGGAIEHARLRMKELKTRRR